jgi:dienelactone hydrolase
MTTIATEIPNQRLVLRPIATAQWIGCLIAFIAASVSAADGISTDAGPEGPAQTAYASAKGPGPAIIVISGQSGPARYQNYAAEVARLGYYSVLLDGNHILTRDREGAANLMKAIERAQRSPHAIPGKTAVIGFSMGGGGALRHAASMPDLVSVVVTYYPFTSFRSGAASLVQSFRVPVLVMAGERDLYKNCCLIESARAMEAAAKETGAKFELVVYPEADHGFNHQGSRNYRRDDEKDAWRRTIEMLRLHQPLR